MDYGVTTAIIHTLLHAKKYSENPECRCGPEYTNYHPDIHTFNAIQKVLQREMPLNSLRGCCAKDPDKNNIKHHHKCI